MLHQWSPTMRNRSSMRQPRIAVVGSANIDLTTVHRPVFPLRPGETIFGKEFHLGFGGKGANQAVAARSVRRAGFDDCARGRRICSVRRPSRTSPPLGIDAGHVRLTPNVSSGVAPIFVDSAGQNRILVVMGANEKLMPADVDAAAEVLGAADCIVLQLEIPIGDGGLRIAFRPAKWHSQYSESRAGADARSVRGSQRRLRDSQRDRGRSAQLACRWAVCTMPARAPSTCCKAACGA